MRQCLFSKEKEALEFLFLTQTESPVPQLYMQNIFILPLHSSHTHQTHLKYTENVRSSPEISPINRSRETSCPIYRAAWLIPLFYKPIYEKNLKELTRAPFTI